MPPYYTCRMCDKNMATNVEPNTDLFFVKNKKGWFGHEWECAKCYRSRPVGPMTDRDGFREKGVTEVVLTEDKYKGRKRSDVGPVRESISKGLSNEDLEIAQKNWTGHA